MKAKVTLVFNVTDPARLKTLADAAIASLTPKEGA